MSKSRIIAKISLDNIVKNIENSYAGLPASVKRCAVIKADGYGHGAVAVAQRIRGIVDFFAVASAEEALELRDAGIELPILILGYVWPVDYVSMMDQDIRIPIFKLEDAARLQMTAEAMDRKALVHIVVDTGMNRIGFTTTPDSVDIVRQIRQMDMLEVEGIFTHFCRADEADKSYTMEQYRRFSDFIDQVEKGCDPIPIRHCGNSATILEMKDYHMDMMRLGISMYGVYPSDEVARDVPLYPAMELKSHIVHIKTVAKGEGIGYNHTARLTEDRVIATVPVGYADGYPRSLSNTGTVLVRGRRAPIIGRICMDQFMIDVTDIPDASFADEVTLVGRDGAEEITMDELADICGTIPYELMCAVSKRVPRLY